MIPEQLRMSAQLEPDVRRRGIYDIPLYRASIEMEGVIRVPPTPSLGIQDDHEIHYSGSYLVTAVSVTYGERNVEETS